MIGVRAVWKNPYNQLDTYSAKLIVGDANVKRKSRERRKKHNTRKWTSIVVLSFGVLMALEMLLSSAGV